jgi:membrane-associated protein
MDLLLQLLDFILHVDRHLQTLATEYGTWIYGILFLIVFCETGLVVTPFLPGDSLLFAAGALCAADVEAKGMSILVLVPLLVTAAFVGDQVNYFVGHLVGPRFLERERLPFIKRTHVEKTQRYYETYGGKTVIMARFVPIVRTFAPFIAGIGSMKYPRFATFSITGGVLWVSICSLAGYFFGQIPVVKKNFELVVIGIIAISVLPIVIELLRARAAKKG